MFLAILKEVGFEKTKTNEIAYHERKQHEDTLSVTFSLITESILIPVAI